MTVSVTTCVGCHGWLWLFYFPWRWRQSPLLDFHHHQGFQKALRQRSFRVLMMFCHVLSCSVCCLVVTGNLSDEHWLHWLGFCVAFCWVCGFVSLLLFACFLASVVCTAVRRALCLRRLRRRVGCSGQAVPCLVLRRCQQAVLFYMWFCWWLLMHVDANVGSWCCMPMHADACWCIWIHVVLEVCWLLRFSKDVEGPWNRLAVCAWDFDIG